MAELIPIPSLTADRLRTAVAQLRIVIDDIDDLVTDLEAILWPPDLTAHPSAQLDRTADLDDYESGTALFDDITIVPRGRRL